MNLQEAIELRDAARAAYQKSLEAKSYQVGDGHVARSVERNASDALRRDFMHWDAEVTRLQNTASGRGRIMSMRGPR